MKRLICFLTAFLLLLSLAGCGHGSRSMDPVSFYYCRDPGSYQYFERNGVIQSELRDMTEHRNDLKYLLSLYLAGPMEEGLVSPFSRQVRLLSVTQVQENLQVEISDPGQTMSDAQFSLACACLTLTCLDVSSCTSVTVISGSKSITLDNQSILLFDAASGEQPTDGG